MGKTYDERVARKKKEEKIIADFQKMMLEGEYSQGLCITKVGALNNETHSNVYNILKNNNALTVHRKKSKTKEK